MSMNQNNISLEKVLHALYGCANVQSEFTDAVYVCPTCAYGLDDGQPCESLHPLLDDAYALLKAQEPRVMTYEELSTIDGAFIIESSAVHPLEWVFFFDTDAKSDAVWVQGFDGERFIVYREDYGIYVRCWTSRPDQATREATPWE